MDFLTKLYLLNFVHHQQQSASVNQVTQAASLADPIANSNFYQQQIFLQNTIDTMQNIYSDLSKNTFNTQINNYLFPSTVISTPSPSFEESDCTSSIGFQQVCNSTNNFSSPSSLSSDKSSILVDSSSTTSPLCVRNSIFTYMSQKILCVKF